MDNPLAGLGESLLAAVLQLTGSAGSRFRITCWALQPSGQKVWRFVLQGRWHAVPAKPGTFRAELDGTVTPAPAASLHGRPAVWGELEFRVVNLDFGVVKARPYCHHSHIELNFGEKSIIADQDHSFPSPDYFRAVLRGEISPALDGDDEILVGFSLLDALKVMCSLQFA